MNRFYETWQDFKAWRRGEHRVAVPGVRGRVYMKTDESASATKIKTKTVFKVKARVIRADGRPDEYYEL